MNLKLFLFLLLLISACSAPARKDDHWMAKDKLYHFSASAVIGASSAAVFINNRSDDEGAFWLGMSAVTSVGAGKEVYDLKVKRTYWSWKDMLWDMIGGTLGCYAVYHSK